MPHPKGFQLPSVRVTEIDKSAFATPVGTSTGALVISAKKGPINRRVLIASEKQLIETFGTPLETNNLSKDFGAFTAIEFLKESGALWVVRAGTDNAGYANLEIGEVGSQFDDNVDFNINGINGIDTPNNVYRVDFQGAQANSDYTFGAVTYNDPQMDNTYNAEDIYVYNTYSLDSTLATVSGFPTVNQNIFVEASGQLVIPVGKKLLVDLASEVDTNVTYLIEGYNAASPGVTLLSYEMTNATDPYQFIDTTSVPYPTGSSDDWSTVDSIRYYVIGATVQEPALEAVMYMDGIDVMSSVQDLTTVSDLLIDDSDASIRDVAKVIVDVAVTDVANPDNIYDNYPMVDDLQGVQISGSSFATYSGEFADGNKGDLIKEIEEDFTFSANNVLLVSAIGTGTNEEKQDDQLAISIEGPTLNGEWYRSFDDDPTAADAIWKQVYRINVYLNENYSEPVEQFWVSNVKTKDENGASLFAEDLINGSSSYIYVKVDETYSNVSNPYALPTGTESPVILKEGFSNETTGSIQSAAWALFNDPGKVNVDIAMLPYGIVSQDADKNLIRSIINSLTPRKDLIITAQAGTRTQSPSNIIDVFNNGGYSVTDPSYVAWYAGTDKIYDRYNDTFVWAPRVIFGGYLYAKVDNIGGPHIAPAGLNYGSVGSLEPLIAFSDAEVGDLMNVGVNSMRIIQGQGNFIWTQVTALLKNSVLQRINIRRLMLFIEKSLKTPLAGFLFEPNNEQTRARVSFLINSFMETVDGVDEYRVVVDDTNNSASDENNKLLNIDLFVRPEQTIEYIDLRVTVTGAGISFDEL